MGVLLGTIYASKGNEYWFEKSGLELERIMYKENENRFNKSRGLRRRGFEHLGSHRKYHFDIGDYIFNHWIIDG